MQCPSCGEAQPDNLTFCDQCGARLASSSGLFIPGASLGLPAPVGGGLTASSPAAAGEDAALGAAGTERFVPFASRPALRASR